MWITNPVTTPCPIPGHEFLNHKRAGIATLVYIQINVVLYKLRMRYKNVLIIINDQYLVS